MGYEAADGSLYYVKSRNAESGIWRKPAGGGVESPVVPPVRPYNWSFWTLLNGGIYFVSTSGPNGQLTSTLKFQSLDGRTKVIEPLENLRLIGYPGLAVSPSGDRS